MSSPALTFSQIRARVRAVRRKMAEGKIPEARFIGITVQGRWSGERLRHDGADTYLIEQCDSSLAARIALLNGDPAVTMTVLVTSLSREELGEDVVVRLAGRQLYPIETWQIVKEQFQAQTVDPRLRSHPWIADRLLELAGQGNPPPAPGGYLDAEAAWPLLLDWLIGLGGERPDLAALLRWSAITENVQRFCRLSEEGRQVVGDWLAGQIGRSAAAVLRCAATLERPDALAVGLALGVVHHPKAGGRLDRAAGRLERFLGGATPEAEVLDRWHAAATEAIRLLDSDRRAKGQLLDRAEEILREVQAESFAHFSDVLPLGFDQRLARLGGLLGEPSQAEALEAVRKHDQARREPRRLEAVEMALRLVRWLKATPNATASPGSLAESAHDYLAQGSFVDWARSVLRTVGEPVRGLAEGYARLLAQVAARREQENRRFAELLCDQLTAGRPIADPIPVERILDEVVAPLAAGAPVLLIVLDGMSPAVSRELMADLARSDWITLGPEGRAVRPGLAAVPCVTEASRTSLFCGTLRTGTAVDETAGFAAHPGLRPHCRSGHPPVLFHKIALQEAGDASLAGEVREAIASTHKRVVAVVINAVDDHLLKGEQLGLHWTRDEIKVLPSLLYEARSARRIVVLLSDHGHLLDYQTELRSGEGGERWRPADGKPAEVELVVRGPWVLLGEGHRLIAPWSERIRYVKRKNGYHGGLTPQEMLIPITVLASGDLRLAGWAETPDPTPEWWEDLPAPSAPVPAPLVKPPPPKSPETLWDIVEPEPPVVHHAPPQPADAGPQDWISALLACPLFEGQKRLAGRAVPADEVLARLLSALDASGGKMTAMALARRLEMPLFRLRGLLAVVGRVLNIDGYAVLGRDEPSDTIELNRDLLLRQFDLLAEDRP
jgi:hypothetical protein